jgi:hypothetical protein
MQAMFHSASAFNQDIGSWDILSLKNATGMFNGSMSFTLPTSQLPMSWLKMIAL